MYFNDILVNITPKVPSGSSRKCFFCVDRTWPKLVYLFIWGLYRFQHCTGHITRGSLKGRGNQNIQLVKVLYCKLPTNGKELPAFPLEAVPGTEPRPQRWEERALPLCHLGPWPKLEKCSHFGRRSRSHSAYRKKYQNFQECPPPPVDSCNL